MDIIESFDMNFEIRMHDFVDYQGTERSNKIDNLSKIDDEIRDKSSCHTVNVMQADNLLPTGVIARKHFNRLNTYITRKLDKNKEPKLS